MNNKSDKKQKRKQKQTKHKKKTASHKSKTKKEIKRGGAPSFSYFKGFFSKKSNSNKMPELQQKQHLYNTASSASPNPQSSVSLRNPQHNINQASSNQTMWKNPIKLSILQEPLLPKQVKLSNNLESKASTNPQPEIPNIQPNAQPQGFKTIESQSRCSIQ